MYLHFPENYMWSMGVFRALMAGGDFGEIAHACDSLGEASRPNSEYPNGNPALWLAAWSGIAGELQTLAERSLVRSHRATARDAYFRAAIYWQWAGAYLDPEHPEVVATFDRHLDCFRKAAGLLEMGIEFVELPYEGTTLPAYYVPALHKPDRTCEVPAVVLHDGVDGTKEEMFMTARALAERGVAVLSFDGPGHGEALWKRDLAARHDFEVPAAACVDWLLARPEVDGTRLGIVGASVGGYYVPRAAAMDHRYKVCVAWGAVWDYHAVWQRRFQLSGTRVAEDARAPMGTTHRHILRILKAATYEEALQKLEPFHLRDVAKKIVCDFLVVHGEDDRQIPLADAEALHKAASSVVKELWVYKAAEGGVAHVQLDRHEPCRAQIADWVAERLGAAEQRGTS